eukprot:559249-Rhodomonas_salina.1
MEQFKNDFLQRFDCTNEGAVHEYLGCEVVLDWEKGSLSLLQRWYTERVLKIYGFDKTTPVCTPLSPGISLTKQDCPAVLDPALHRLYRGIVGHLSFLVQCTHPDLSFAYAELSKFVAYPGQKHMEQAEHGWVDSDFAADPDTWHSVTGYVVSLNNGPVAWKAKRQACTTLSSAEAEFVTASLCGQEVICLRSLLRGFGFEHWQTSPITVYEDNASCIAMSHKLEQVKQEHSSHIDTRLYFLWDMVRDKVLKLAKCPGTENVTDALTKSVPGPTLAKHREYLLGTHVPFKTYSVKHLAYPWGSRVPFQAMSAALASASAVAAAA